MALKLLEDDDKTFKVERDDGQVVHIAKTPETMPIYKLCKGGMVAKEDDDTPDKSAPISGGYSQGGKVEGKAKVQGDSPKNDTVNAKLSPGEIVIPRSIANDPEKILKFVRGALSGEHTAEGENHFAGGAIPDVGGALSSLFGGIASQASSAGASTHQPQPAVAPVVAAPPPQAMAMPLPEPTVPIEAEPGLNPPVAPTAQPVAATPAMLAQTKTATQSEAPTAAQAKGAQDLDTSIAGYQKNLVDAGSAAAQLQLAKSTADANILNEQNLKMQAFAEKRAAEVTRRLEEVKKVESQFSGMAVDSGRFFGDGLTGNKIMAGIGLALGALGQAVSGKDYGVNSIIERAIDRDIEVQKANINSAGKQVDLVRGGLTDYMKATGDIEAAMNAEKARQLEAVAKQFEAIAAGNSSAAVQAAAAEKALPLREKAQALRNQVGKDITTKTIETAPPSAEALAKKEELAVPGYGYAKSAASAQELRKLSASSMDANHQLDVLTNVLGEVKANGARQLSPTLRKKAEVAQQTLVGQAREMLVGPGSLSESDKKTLNAVIADPTKFFSFDSANEEALNDLRATFKNVLSNRLIAEGVVAPKKPEVTFKKN